MMIFPLISGYKTSDYNMFSRKGNTKIIHTANVIFSTLQSMPILPISLLPLLPLLPCRMHRRIFNMTPIVPPSNQLIHTIRIRNSSSFFHTLPTFPTTITRYHTLLGVTARTRTLCITSSRAPSIHHHTRQTALRMNPQTQVIPEKVQVSSRASSPVTLCLIDISVVSVIYPIDADCTSASTHHPVMRKWVRVSWCSDHIGEKADAASS